MSDGTLSFATAIDTSGLKRGVERIQSMVSGAGQQLSNGLNNAAGAANTLEGALKRVGAAVGIAFSATQAWEFVKHIRDVRSEIQSLEISFETLLGSKEKADALFGSIREFAVNTPMQLKDLAAAAQMMLSFNIEESKIMPYLQALGDVSMGDTAKFQSLSLAFSQMSSAGKLMGQDLMQMINAGFNPLAQMAQQTGKSISELKDEMSAGKITADMVQQAFIDATSAGGKFAGMLEKQSHGIAGAMSNLQGAIDDMFNELGQQSEGILTGMYTAATAVVKNWKDIAVAISSAAAAYGMYKAATMASVAVDRVTTTAAINAEAAELAKVIALKEADANADIQAAVASGKLSEAKGKAIIAARAEAAAVVESLQAKAADAKADLACAVSAESAAKARYLASVQNLKAAEMQLVAAKESGDAFRIMSAQANVDSAATERNTALKQYNAAIVDTRAKRQAAAAAATTADTAATQLNSAAETANTTTTNFLAAAKTRLLAVMAKLRAAMLAHPYGIALAAVTALAYGIYKLCTTQTDAEKAQRRLNDATRECNQSIDAEQAKLSFLFSRLKNAKEGTEEYKNAKDAIISQYGSYLQNLNSEIATLKDVEGAYNAVAEAARRSARERAIANVVNTEADALAKTQSDIKDKIYKWAQKQYGDAKLEDGTFAADDTYWKIVKALDDPTKAISESFLQKFDKVVVESIGTSSPARTSVRNPLRTYIAQYKQANKIYQDSLEEAGRRFGDAPEAKAEEAKAQTYEEAYNAAKSSWEKANAALVQMQKSKSKFTKAQYDEAVATAKAAKEAFEKLGGKTTKSASGANAEYAADAATEKLTSVERRQARDRQRLQEDLEFELWQGRIDAGRYGSQSYIQQRQLDFKKEQTQLQRQMEDAIDAEVARQKEVWDKQEEASEKEAKKKGKKYTKRAFDSDNLSGMEFKPGTTFEDKTIGDVEMAGIYAITAQYAKLQDVLQAKQQKSLQDEAKRQKEAMDEYLAEWGKYAQKRQAIIDIANAKLNDPDANLTEGERKSITAQMTKDLADLDMESFKKSLGWEQVFADMDKVATPSLKNIKAKLREFIDTNKNLSPEAIKTLKDAIEKIDEKLTGRDPFRTMSSDFGELHVATIAVNEAQKAYNKALKEGSEEEQAAALKTLNAARDVKQAALTKATASLQSAVSTSKEWLAVGNAIVDCFASFGVEMPAQLTGFLEGMNNTLNALGSIDLTRPASIITGAFGAVAGLFTGFASLFNNDAAHQKRIEELQKQVDELNDSYAELDKTISKTYSKDAANLIEQRRALMQQQVMALQLIAAEEEAKKKTDQSKIDEVNEQIADITSQMADLEEQAHDAIFGEDIKSAIENFASAYADAWANGEDRAQSAKDTVKSMMRQMVTESIKAAIQSSEAMERIREQLEKFYTDDDNVLSEWEQNRVMSMAEELQAELDKQFGWAESLLDDSTREGSKKGIATASQDSVDENNARLTTIQAHTYTLVQGMQELNRTGSAMLARLTGIENNTTEANTYLDDVERTVRRIRDAVDDISTHGIKIK